MPTPQATDPLEYSPFVYQAKADRVVDGDTIDLSLDLGFSVLKNKTRVRLVNVDTNERPCLDDESFDV